MRIVLWLSLMTFGSLAYAQGQAPAPAKPAAQTPAPAQPQPRPTAPRRAPAPAARSGMAITVTSMTGATIPGVHVEVMGPVTRMGDTDASGQLNLPGMQAGTYRLRFSGDSVTAFEKEVTVRAGQVADVDVSLAAAPPPREVKVPAPAPATDGPAGEPQWGSLVELEKKALQAKPQPKELLLSCSGNTRTVMQLLTEDQTDRLYQEADATYYVLDGQGSIKIGDRDGAIGPGSFVSVPRGMSYSVTINRRAKGPLVLLWTLSGERCETAR